MRDESLKKYLRIQQQQMEPSRAVIEAQRREWKAIQDAMEPSRKYMQAFNAAIEPARQHMDAIKAAFEPTRRQMEALNEAMQPARRQMEALNEAMEPARKYFENMQAALESAGLARVREMLSASSVLQSDAVRSYFERSQRLSASALLDSKWMREFEEDARIRAKVSRLAAIEDAAIEMPEFLPELVEPDPVIEDGELVSLAEPVRRDKLAEWWSSLSLLQRFFLLLFFQFVVVPAYERQLLDRYLLAPDEATRTTIVRELDESLGSAVLDPVRCVRANGLNVRSAPSTSADVLAKLPEGLAVEALEREGGFWHIRYVDPQSGEMREGWAATSRLVPVC